MTDSARPRLLEICVDSADACARAAKGGAQRVELCADLTEGGITPSVGMIRAARRATAIPIMVIIRPRGGDFVASSTEVDAMVTDIEIAKAEGIEGVVIGSLTRQGDIDQRVLDRLMEAADGLDVTFHRAFDHTRDLDVALDILIRHRVPRVLTSGGQPTAVQGIDAIAQLVTRANGRISVMPGGGLREEHLAEVALRTGAREFHATAFLPVRSDAYFRPEVPISKSRVPGDGDRTEVSPDRVRAMLKCL